MLKRMLGAPRSNCQEYSGEGGVKHDPPNGTMCSCPFACMGVGSRTPHLPESKNAKTWYKMPQYLHTTHTHRLTHLTSSPDHSQHLTRVSAVWMGVTLCCLGNGDEEERPHVISVDAVFFPNSFSPQLDECTVQPMGAEGRVCYRWWEGISCLGLDLCFLLQQNPEEVRTPSLRQVWFAAAP